MDTYDQGPRSLSEESSRTKSKGGGFQRKYNNAIFPFFFFYLYRPEFKGLNPLCAN